MRVGVCISVADIGGDEDSFVIGITGGTQLDTLAQFEPAYLLLAPIEISNASRINKQLNVTLGFNQKNCSNLGWLDIDILNGISPFRYSLKNQLVK